jgi:hypothetical protein
MPILGVRNEPKFQIIGLLTSFWVFLIWQENNKLIYHPVKKLVHVLLKLLPAHSSTEKKALSLLYVVYFKGLDSQNSCCWWPAQCGD